MSSRILSSGYASHSELCHSWDYVIVGIMSEMVFSCSSGLCRRALSFGITLYHLGYRRCTVSVIVGHSYLREQYEPSV